jgi:hypothetical protein
MIPNKLKSINKNQQGSSFSLPAHGWVGARATLLFPAAHFALQNTNSVSPEPKRSPAALLVQGRVPQKSFLYLLEEKIGHAQIKKCEENFFAGWRALASGSGAKRQFRSKKFRAKLKFKIFH